MMSITSQYNQKGIAAACEAMEYEIMSTASMVASTYAKIGMKDVIEEWVESIVDDVRSGKISPDIRETTSDNREERGNPRNPALFETGEMLSYLEAHWTCLPDKPYDLVSVGIFNDEDKIGHGGADGQNEMTPVELATIHEYGFSGDFRDDKGLWHVVMIPARPIFTQSTENLGFDRIMRNAEQKVNIAVGRERRSVKRRGQGSTSLGGATMKWQRKFESKWGGSAKPPGMVRKTQIGKLNDAYEFYWVNTDVEDEYEKALS